MNQTINNSKIFGIGLSKTGTTTLGECGRILGYRCKACDRELLKDVILGNNFTGIKEEVKKNDLFQDWPWPLIYKELDLMFPESKFILTVRKNEEIWLDSLKKHSMRGHPVRPCRDLAYGYNYPYGHEKEHLEFYRRHNDNVRSFFKGRDNDFIEICWDKGHGWNELCAFLGKDILDVPFPHENKGSDQPISKMRFLTNCVGRFLSS
jgi:hypothetical protein